mmetsp:Transcript_4901/g.8827  ORF Transcript_4901/g.8827 Transcript_4901/m.8827 type:complete len:106 (-) Transcript_4901:1781-2098(-)
MQQQCNSSKITNLPGLRGANHKFVQSHVCEYDTSSSQFASMGAILDYQFEATYRITINLREFELFLLINLETLIAVIALTSSSSTPTSLSPSRTLSAMGLVPFTL